MCRNKPAVIVYGKNSCPQCDMTRKLLDRDQIDYTYINIEDDADAYNYVTKTLGYRQAPAVVALFPDGSETHWSGFQPARIAGYARAARAFKNE